MINKQEYKNKITGEVLPFQTKYSYENDKSEKNDMPSETDATLFVPLKTMINKIVRGDLSEIANVYFDDQHEDPTDAPGYDLADAFEDMQKAQDMINEQLQQENKAENSPKAPETEVSEATETESNAAK